jgi:hypothetical protein
MVAIPRHIFRRNCNCWRRRRRNEVCGKLRESTSCTVHGCERSACREQRWVRKLECARRHGFSQPICHRSASLHQQVPGCSVARVKRDRLPWSSGVGSGAMETVRREIPTPRDGGAAEGSSMQSPLGGRLYLHLLYPGPSRSLSCLQKEWSIIGRC